MRYEYKVVVNTDTFAHAEQVMAERTGYDEQYEDEGGVEFDYQFGLITALNPPEEAS